MKGSEWKRWELHMHTPNTKKNDGFSGKTKLEKWDKYYECISKYISEDKVERNIKALAVTDYLSIDNYVKIITDKKIPTSIELVMPNVELRLNLKGHKSPINFHCIFNPNIADELNDRFFSKLKFYDGTRYFSGTTNELISLGRSISPKIEDKDQLLKIGIENFIIDLSCLQDLFNNDDDLRKNTILIVANKQGDGASGLRGEQYGATKRTLYRFVDAIFSGTESDIKYFLGKNGKDDVSDVIESNGKLMPCFHGSDAHKFEDIFEPNMMRYCYIKSEISFEGLKQTLTDPEDRVFIGEKPPILRKIERNPEKFIESIKLSKENNADSTWFQEDEIKLNPQLNVIIGNKGAGKTALADIIGLCANSNRYKDFVFLNKFKNTKQSKETFAELIYLNGIKTSIKKLSDPIEEKSETVKYLPQSYFESITNEIEKVEDFRLELEKVIFQYLSEQEKEDASSFSEYKKSIGKIEKMKIIGLQEELSIVNKEIIELEDRSTPERIKQIKADYDEIRAILEAHIKVKPNKIKKSIETNSPLQKYENRLKRLKTIREEVSSALKETRINRRKLEEFKFEFEKRMEAIENFIELNENLFNELDYDLNFQFTYEDELLEEKLIELDTKIKSYEQCLSKSSKGDFLIGNTLSGKIIFCEEKIEELTSKESETIQSIKKNENEYEIWKEKEKSLLGDVKDPKEGSKNYLEKELKYITGKLIDDLEELESTRLGISKKIMINKQIILEKFENTTNSLQSALEENEERSIMIVNEFVLSPNFKREFLNNINQSRVSLFRGSFEGEENLEKIIDDYLEKDSNFLNIEMFLNNLLYSLKYVEKNEKKQNTNLQNIIYDRQNLYDYIFGLKYISNEFDLRLGEKKLEQLSPGERGAVLLIFYLLLDKDTSPLLIDQPEDNLDNQSVADILVPYIKKAKNRRQVIMVTHNPNLAVVSDAELVIYVNLDKEKDNRFSYISGGIENPNINKKIQDILEGTPKAFRTRDKKYHNY